MSVYVITTNNIYVVVQVYDEKCDICIRLMYILRIICVCIYDTNTNNMCIYMW